MPRLVLGSGTFDGVYSSRYEADCHEEANRHPASHDAGRRNGRCRTGRGGVEPRPLRRRRVDPVVRPEVRGEDDTHAVNLTIFDITTDAGFTVGPRFGYWLEPVPFLGFDLTCSTCRSRSPARPEPGLRPRRASSSTGRSR